MTQNKKTILYIDLCGRLPYNTIISVAEMVTDGEMRWNDTTLTPYLFYQFAEEEMWDYVKPYLRPMGSMTEGERRTYKELSSNFGFTEFYKASAILIGWLNQKMLGYRHLIPNGLAIEAPNGMYDN